MVALLKRRQVYIHNHRRRRFRRRATSVGIGLTLLLFASLITSSIVAAKRRTGRIPIKTASKSVIRTSEYPHQPSKKGSVSVLSPVVGSAPQVLPAEVANDCKQPNNDATALTASSNPQIRKLAEYSQVCSASPIKSSFIFSSIPRTNKEADDLANDISGSLAGFATAGLSPYVIVEPQFGNEKIDLAGLQNSNLGSVFEYYLNQLKSKGITDSEAGTWVLFPEPNIPEWTSVDPGVFKTNFTNFGTLFKEYFKTAKLGVMLDSMSYATNSYSGDRGYASLLPYVNGLPAGLVDSLGYQGFPWLPPADSNQSSSVNAADFLRPALAIEAASTLGIKDVWLNTGTFGSYYTSEPSKTVHLDASQRTGILSDIIAQAAVLKKSGLKVALNLFAEDKSSTSEAADWSYWPAGKSAASEGAAVYSKFSSQLHDQKISLGIYDSY